MTTVLPEAATPPPTVECQRISATPTHHADAQCPVHSWCIEVGDHTWHNSESVTVHVECGLDKTHNHGHNLTPYIDARLISEDDPAAGIRGARAAVSIDDCEVDAAGARREAAKLRAALLRIETLADILDGKPPTSAIATQVARYWTITTETGVTVRGHLPEWAEQDPSKANIPANRLQLHVSDVHHSCHYDGPTVKVDVPGYDTDRYTGDDQILQPTMRCLPHSDDPANRIPVVVVEAVAGSDVWLGPFDPGGVCALADKLRAHADYLDDIAAHLQDAREDWARNGRQP
jgi:hypothetical protein